MISEYSPDEAALAASRAGGDGSCDAAEGGKEGEAAGGVERMRLLLHLAGGGGHYELLVREE